MAAKSRAEPQPDGFSDFFFSAPDGLRLHARIYGGGHDGALPVVCLPGLTRNARDFHELALHLSRRAARPRKVIAFDYRGRGRSAYDPSWKNYSVPVEAADVLAGLTAFGLDEAAFIGTSRGGLILHVLTALRPSVLKAIILNDIGPVVESAGLAQIRAYLENASKPATPAEAVAAQKAVHGAAFPALGEADWARFVNAIYRIEPGRPPVPDFDPALLNTLAGLDFSQPLPALWPQFEAFGSVPLMVIRGENSALLSAATVLEMARRHPGLELIVVPGQGHAPFLETGDLPARIESFIDRADPR
jgi:pimeloyl-ACP methyl ester carboxylesterase